MPTEEEWFSSKNFATGFPLTFSLLSFCLSLVCTSSFYSRARAMSLPDPRSIYQSTLPSISRSLFCLSFFLICAISFFSLLPPSPPLFNNWHHSRKFLHRIARAAESFPFVSPVSSLSHTFQLFPPFSPFSTFSKRAISKHLLSVNLDQDAVEK